MRVTITFDLEHAPAVRVLAEACALLRRRAEADEHAARTLGALGNRAGYESFQRSANQYHTMADAFAEAAAEVINNDIGG